MILCCNSLLADFPDTEGFSNISILYVVLIRSKISDHKIHVPREFCCFMMKEQEEFRSGTSMSLCCNITYKQDSSSVRSSLGSVYVLICNIFRVPPYIFSFSVTSLAYFEVIKAWCLKSLFL